MTVRPVSEKLRIVNDYISEMELPIEVTPLANRLGIRVYRAPWPNEISGKIQKDAERGGESGFAIFVNQDHPAVRRRFTIAHEIAHYVLHERKIGDGIFDDALYRSGLPHREEVQANALAADILMPKKLVREMQGQHGDEIGKLAEIFWVSEQAMSIRLGVPT
ncbi:ImmA/IrrE family metallo-endopeptidase [Roseovarius sp. CAU 1744]|uniref:ImmA/IrrE family metallo-endopeptidase n=1 Tax=Roseovarius sp. CAU 1744 TaxID=3140368 RepID=UPI00325C29E1